MAITPNDESSEDESLVSSRLFRLATTPIRELRELTTSTHRSSIRSMNSNKI